MIERVLKFGLLIGVFFAVAGASAYLTLVFFIGDDNAIVVPDLSGKHVGAALELLTDLSLNAKIKGMEYSAEVPRYHVITQHPSAGAEIKPGRDVRLTLSKGRDMVAVPSVKALSFNQARIVLEENGLVPGNIARIYNEKAAPNVILEQVPPSGKTVHRKEAIDLLISLGKRPVDFMMPDYTGLTLDEAIKGLEKGRLVLGAVRSIIDESYSRERIMDQSPPPGSRVFAETVVDLSVNRKATPESRHIEKRTGLILFRHRVAPGFLNRHIRIRLNGYGTSTDLLDMFVKPGKEVWCFIPAESNTSAFLYEDDILIRSEVIE